MDDLINYDFVKKYIKDLTPDTDPFLNELERYAMDNHIPIITKDTRRFAEVLINIIKPLKILEIGTAIGYSAIVFLKSYENCKVTTIEIEEEMFDLAYENIKKAGLKERVNLILDDAINILPYLDTTYDFIFVDAAKGQYTQYYKYLKRLIKKGGIIMFDNVLFKGLVASRELVPRNKRAIVRDLSDFNKEIMQDNLFLTSIIPLGDGIALSLRKDDK